MGKSHLSHKEVLLALVLGIVGLMLNSREVLLFVNTLNPLMLLLVYYVVLYVLLWGLGKAGLVVFGTKIKNAKQRIGLLLIASAFFLCINWENPYVQYVTTGSLGGASPIFYGSEDGAAWFIYSMTFPGLPVEAIWFLTFFVTVVALVLVGGYCVSGKLRIET